MTNSPEARVIEIMSKAADALMETFFCLDHQFECGTIDHKGYRALWKSNLDVVKALGLTEFIRDTYSVEEPELVDDGFGNHEWVLTDDPLEPRFADALEEIVWKEGQRALSNDYSLELEI